MPDAPEHSAQDPASSQAEAIAVDRAADDIRRGVPVMVTDEQHGVLLIASELLDQNRMNALLKLLPDESGLSIGVLISGHRAQQIKVPHKGREAVMLPLDTSWTTDQIAALGDPTLDLNNPIRGPFKDSVRGEWPAEIAALKLLKIARLLPSALCVSGQKTTIVDLTSQLELLSVNAAAVNAYDRAKALDLQEVARAHVPLENAENTVVVSFRPASGGPEHLVLLIGAQKTSSANDPTLVRLHSECLTGDILGSLKCDCGTQLQEAIKSIRDAGGGILLYLAQEGRGIGLNAKLKAYALQDQGYDTVDANLRLGFGIDERYFLPAAVMLKALSAEHIKLLTNNPDKVKALEEFGIQVHERVPHHFPPNAHNEAYLKTKKQRTGHIL